MQLENDQLRVLNALLQSLIRASTKNKMQKPTISICFLSSTTWADIAAFSFIKAVQSS